MTSWSRIAALPAAAMTIFVLDGCGGDKATLETFAGTWQGHGRTLNITRTGNAEEWISLGLGHFVIALRFHLSRPRRTPHDALANSDGYGRSPREHERLHRGASATARGRVPQDSPPRRGHHRDAGWSALLQAHRQALDVCAVVRRGLWRIGQVTELGCASVRERLRETDRDL